MNKKENAQKQNVKTEPCTKSRSISLDLTKLDEVETVTMVGGIEVPLPPNSPDDSGYPDDP